MSHVALVYPPTRGGAQRRADACAMVKFKEMVEKTGKIEKADFTELKNPRNLICWIFKQKPPRTRWNVDPGFGRGVAGLAGGGDETYVPFGT